MTARSSRAGGSGSVAAAGPPAAPQASRHGPRPGRGARAQLRRLPGPAARRTARLSAVGVGQPFAAPPETVTRAVGTPPAPVVDRWAFARALSPRRTVRVADVDSATGRARNAYGSELPLRGPFPGRPYAVYLTDRGGRFRLLGFDLDAGKGPVAADLARLCALLDRARPPPLLCPPRPPRR